MNQVEVLRKSSIRQRLRPTPISIFTRKRPCKAARVERMVDGNFLSFHQFQVISKGATWTLKEMFVVAS